MKKLLIVVDMQNDFVTGALGTKEAEKIVPNVKARIERAEEEGWDIWFTKDTHGEDYLKTQEGAKLPVEHCIRGTKGWEIIDELKGYAEHVAEKPSFGSVDLAEAVKTGGYEETELIGLCTDICVVSNALLIKAVSPELPVAISKNCCAGVTVKTHEAAIQTMEMCQIEIR